MVSGFRNARVRRVWPAGRVAAAGLTVALLAFGSEAWAASAASIDEYVGKPVLEVRFVSEGRPVPDSALLDLVETRVGPPLSMRQIRESVLHLFTLGRFQDVQVDATPLQQGVALRYELIPLQVVERLEFQGLLGLSRRRLRGAIVERYGPNPSFDVVDEAVQALTDLYRDQGYLNARVVADVERSLERDTMVFDINAGARVRIGTVDLEGAPLGPPAQVLARLNVRPGQVYDREAIERRLSDYESELRRRRYYEAELGHTVAVREDGRRVDVTLRVEPGPRVTVVFEGDPLPSGDLSDLVPIAREASVDEDLLEDASQRIEEYLRAQGYSQARVSHRRNAVGNELSIVFDVEQDARYVVRDVEITGNAAVTLEEVQALLRVRRGEPFLQAEFDASVVEITALYRRLGYAQVQVQQTMPEIARPAAADEEVVAVIPRIVIDEGKPTTIGSIAFDGNEDPTDADLHAAIRSRPDNAYYDVEITADRDAISLLYLNNGYEAVSVDVGRTPSADGRTMDVLFTIREGPQIIVDHVLIVGNRQIAASTIRREITLVEGEPLGLAEVFESRRRLNALGLFRGIDIREFSHGGGNRRDVVIVVDEAPATSVAYGAGLEVSQRLRRESGAAGQAVERVEFAPRGFFEIGRRNLWGRNRSVDLFTRVSFRPSDSPDPGEGSNLGFNEYRVLGTYQEPRAFGLTGNVLVNAFIEKSIRSSFNLFRRGVHAELRRSIQPMVSISAGYTFGQNRLSEERFDPADELLIDRLFPTVELSTFSTALVRDVRDDPFEPTGGSLIVLDVEVAGRRIGSEVGFAKTVMQGFVYRRWPGSRRIIIAAGVQLGLARGFPLEGVVTDNGPTLPASERFFAGGDTTVRGFALDQLGVHGGQLPPDRQSETTIDPKGFPKGGNAMLVLNSEIRFPLWGNLGAVAFLDAGNVFDRVASLDLGRIRGGAGFGIRYRSPIGPIRVDLGFKLDRGRFLKEREDGTLTTDRERLTALHVSIGQAF